jgi:hypothetical protein
MHRMECHKGSWSNERKDVNLNASGGEIIKLVGVDDGKGEDERW